MRKKIVVLVLLIVLVVPTSNLLVLAQDGGGPFDGMSAEELFPGAINDQERASAMAALLAANLPDARDRFAGKTLTLAVQEAGPRGGISGPYYFWREAFEHVTGAKLEIVEIPSAQLYTTTATDFLIGQGTYDAINIGAWYYGDYIANGWAIPVDRFFGDDSYPQWDREAVADPLKTLYTWGGQWYGVLNDGDAQMLYYRKDILEDPKWQAAFEAETGMPMPVPPKTWQELLAVTSFFNGKDWNGDGDPDDGISLHLRSGGQGMFHFMTLSAPFAITPATGDDPRAVTKYDNIYWFDPEDMTPVINQPGQVAALEYLKELAATGSPSQMGWELAEAWNNFLSGNAIATFSWGDVGSLAEDPSRSTITGKLGGARIPCSDTWYDRELGEFVTDVENPNCVGNTTGGSWHGVISSLSDDPELAYYLLAMHATPSINFWNVVYGWTGVDPNSTSQLFPPRGTASVQDYVNTGYNASDAEEYITGYGENLFSFPITETYLRIPGTVEYWEILDTRLAQAMIGELSPQEALDKVAEEWAGVTDSYGIESQLAIYQASIGYKP
jgi:multiple sugar transport system substrate-binding protein